MLVLLYILFIKIMRNSEFQTTRLMSTCVPAEVKLSSKYDWEEERCKELLNSNNVDQNSVYLLIIGYAVVLAGIYNYIVKVVK